MLTERKDRGSALLPALTRLMQRLTQHTLLAAQLGVTALMITARLGHLEIFRLLLAREDDIDRQDQVLHLRSSPLGMLSIFRKYFCRYDLWHTSEGSCFRKRKRWMDGWI